MRFIETELAGAFIIELELIGDERGWFARSFAAEEFAAHGLESDIAHANVSFNPRAATLRGLHFQVAPHAEAKLVRCTRGRIYDVIVDLRPTSATYRRWFAIELSADGERMLYAPPGFAHGFQTLADDTEVSYLISRPHCAEAARGVRWDDPALEIRWPPATDRLISDRDLSHPLLDA